jgi:lipopolysaccharide export system protein LptC
MKITGGGEVVRFDGHVVMNIDKLPPAESAPQQPAAPAPEATRPAAARPVSSKSSNLK